MTRQLLVHKGLEKRGTIGALYVHEVALLGVGCLLVFFVVLFLRAALHLSLLWFLTAPSIFGIVFFLIKSLRQDENPSFLLSWLSFHCQQPQHLSIDKEHLCAYKKQQTC